MITPKQLVAELKNQGIAISERRLTDWRTKSLLPPLTKRGLGRAKGTVNVWADRSVVDQAVEIHTQLNQTRRADDVLLHLFFTGYEVAVKRVQSVWLANLAGSISITKKNIQKSKGDELIYIEGTIKKLHPKPSIKSNLPDATFRLVQEFTHFLLDPEYELESTNLAVLFLDGLKIKKTDENYAEFDDNYKLAQKTPLNFLRLEDMYKVVHGALCADFKTAQKFITIWRSIVSKWIAIQNRSLTSEEKYFLSLAQSVNVGQVICMYILFIAQKASGSERLEALEVWANKGLKLSKSDLPAIMQYLEIDAPGLETFMQKTAVLINTIDKLSDTKF
jgi:hypothetical protein